MAPPNFDAVTLNPREMCGECLSRRTYGFDANFVQAALDRVAKEADRSSLLERAKAPGRQALIDDRSRASITPITPGCHIGHTAPSFLNFLRDCERRCGGH